MENTETNNPPSLKTSFGPKKIFIIIGVVLALAGGFLLYNYVSNNSTQPNDFTEQTTDTNANLNQNPNGEANVKLEENGITAEGTGNQGFLTVCRDQCGDGICQINTNDCKDDDALNCVCVETPQDCPRDCPGN